MIKIYIIYPSSRHHGLGSRLQSCSELNAKAVVHVCLTTRASAEATELKSTHIIRSHAFCNMMTEWVTIKLLQSDLRYVRSRTRYPGLRGCCVCDAGDQGCSALTVSFS